MKDVFYEYDSYEITSQYQSVIQSDARFCSSTPQ